MYVCVYVRTNTHKAVCNVSGIALLLYSKMLCAGIYFACKFSEALPAVDLYASDVLINYQACTVKFF